MNKKFTFTLFLFFQLYAQVSLAQITMPSIFQDSMILQRDAKIKIWGRASPKEKITVQLAGNSVKTVADVLGNWLVTLSPMKAGGPYSIELKGKNRITIRNVLFGDVWFCSGQSNMVHQLNIHDVLYAGEIAAANESSIRQFLVPTATSLLGPLANVKESKWQAAVGDNVRPFSAVAYFFAKKIYEKYHIPIGIINASVGGTPIEAWMSEDGLKTFPNAIATLQQNKDTAYVNALLRSAYKPSISIDAGMDNKWFSPMYAPTSWRTINLPGYWEDQGLKDLNGVVWYRKDIQVPASMVGKKAKVYLGRIIDADELYINGVQVGATTYQYPQRRYTIPPHLLKEGVNTFAIKITNNASKGGCVPDKPYCIFAGNDTIDLKGTWKYKVGAVFNSTPQATGGFITQYQPASLYNAMVAPLINYTVKGVCWYQGEANSSRPYEYNELLTAMIYDWRTKWHNSDMPFLYAQLPGYMDYNYLPAESNWALLREAQLKTLSVPHTAMAVAIDLGEWNDIHPDNKKDVGNRLALAAMNCAYGKNVVHSGPLFQSARVIGNKIEITFSNTGTGLITHDGEPPGDFAIAGLDKKFVWGQAVIENNKVVVSSKNVAQPAYVRYAWADNPVQANLYNKEGLPASPFRTDK